MVTVTEQVHTYIMERPHIRHAIKQGLINYSALSRKILKDTEIKATKEAILIAARRYKERLQKDDTKEQTVREVLKKSELEARNKMVVTIIEKGAHIELLEEIQQKIRKANGTMYVIEGSKNYTVITQEQFVEKLEPFSRRIVKQTANVALITLKSPAEIEKVSGVVAYLTSLFGEHDVNIVEFLSCWTDTLFVIHNEDVPKTMQFLQF